MEANLKTNASFFHFRIKEHADIKGRLLDLIKNEEYTSVKRPENSITKTDYFIGESRTVNPEYADLFVENISPYLQKMTDQLYAQNWSIHCIWFQQYLKGDSHPWHNHGGANFANVYFLELPDTTMTTELFDIQSKQIIEIEAQEGDLISFPAYFPHRSKINNYETCKTVLAFNSSFDNVNFQLIDNIL